MVESSAKSTAVSFKICFISVAIIILLLVLDAQGSKRAGSLNGVTKQKRILYKNNLSIPMSIYERFGKQLYIKNAQREGPQGWKKLVEVSYDAGGGSIKNYLGKLLKKRRTGGRRWVEVGPGAYKSEIVEYPPDKLKNDLKKLMALKAAMEKRTKNINPYKIFNIFSPTTIGYYTAKHDDPTY